MYLQVKRHGVAALREAGLLIEVPDAALHTLKAMAAMPNVLLAASKPYDASYPRHRMY